MPRPNDLKRFVVGIAEMKVLGIEPGVLATHALGSCIGVTVFDPVAGVAGLLHFMLPEPGSKRQLDDKPPTMFATTGIPQLFRAAYKLGAEKNRMVVCAAGGAALMDDNDCYRIGKRNKMIMRKLFWKNGIKLAGDDTGGRDARTMLMDLQTGSVSVRSKSGERVLWSA